MRFNRYFVSNWAGCLLLAKTQDVYRGREVSVYKIPGEVEFVGVSDGTDCWVAPVSANPFSVNVARLLADVDAGKFKGLSVEEPATSPTPGRRRLTKPEAPQAQNQGRRRLAAPPQENSQQPARRRLHA